MRILGLEPGAQVIILQSVATYAALLSAYLLARPVLRGQTLQAHRELLAGMKPAADDVANLFSRAAQILDSRHQIERSLARRDNALGIGLLIFSLLLFTGAVALQVMTDPQFHSQP